MGLCALCSRYTNVDHCRDFDGDLCAGCHRSVHVAFSVAARLADLSPFEVGVGIDYDRDEGKVLVGLFHTDRLRSISGDLLN